jgi:hypothetical protein
MILSDFDFKSDFAKLQIQSFHTLQMLDPSTQQCIYSSRSATLNSWFTNSFTAIWRNGTFYRCPISNQPPTQTNPADQEQAANGSDFWANLLVALSRQYFQLRLRPAWRVGSLWFSYSFNVRLITFSGRQATLVALFLPPPAASIPITLSGFLRDMPINFSSNYVSGVCTTTSNPWTWEQQRFLFHSHHDLIEQSFFFYYFLSLSLETTSAQTFMGVFCGALENDLAALIHAAPDWMLCFVAPAAFSLSHTDV